MSNTRLQFDADLFMLVGRDQTERKTVRFVCSRDLHNGTWHADAPGFGCSKEFQTPQGAIHGMVADHAGIVERLTQVA